MKQLEWWVGFFLRLMLVMAPLVIDSIVPKSPVGFHVAIHVIAMVAVVLVFEYASRGVSDAARKQKESALDELEAVENAYFERCLEIYVTRVIEQENGYACGDLHESRAQVTEAFQEVQRHRREKYLS